MFKKIFYLLSFYLFLFYPFLLKVKSFLTFKKKNRKGKIPSFYSIILPVFNEEKDIEGKIVNLKKVLGKRKYEIIIISDGSDDNTNTILRKWEKDERIKIVYLRKRQGKAKVLNLGVEMAKGDWLFFTDANVYLNYNFFSWMEKAVLAENSDCFYGNLIYLPFHYSSASFGENVYWSWDKFLSLLEKKSNLNCVGVIGSALLLKKELWSTLPERVILDDLEIITYVLSQKGKISYVKEAIAYEYHVYDSRDSILRKERIIAGAWEWMRNHLGDDLGGVSNQFVLFSHKVLRWFWPFFFLLFLGELLFTKKGRMLILGVIAAVLIEFFYRFLYYPDDVKIKRMYLPFYLIITIISFLKGSWKFFFNQSPVLWKQARRA